MYKRQTYIEINRCGISANNNVGSSGEIEYVSFGVFSLSVIKSKEIVTRICHVKICDIEALTFSVFIEENIRRNR